MVYESNFLVRKSGKKEESYYVDYAGSYAIRDLSAITGLKSPYLEEIYEANGAALDESVNVYYFSNADSARKAVKRILSEIGPDNIGKAVYLTGEEIELIRQALINEGVNTIGTKRKVKDDIFRKLNEA